MNTTATRAPTFFIGHGSPMIAIEPNSHTEAWRVLGEQLRQKASPPRAILSISAHWYMPGTAVTAMRNPRTIHDFGGFPQALFDVRYPAPGDPALARRIVEVLAPVPVSLDEAWGLDHGTWSVLVHMYPQANIPVLQLSIDASQPPQYHYELGRRLRALRDEGVAVFGNGNIVHNLRTMQRQQGAPVPAWANTFNDYVRNALLRGDDAALIDYRACGEAAALSVPTPEHYLPLLYVLGARHEGEPLAILTDGIDMGSISMLSMTAGV